MRISRNDHNNDCYDRAGPARTTDGLIIGINIHDFMLCVTIVLLVGRRSASLERKEMGGIMSCHQLRSMMPEAPTPPEGTRSE